MAADVLINVKAVDQASGVLNGIAGTIAKLGIAAAVVAGSKALFGFLASTVKEASDAENAVSQFNATVKSMGGWATNSSTDLIGLANNLSEVTRFTDEQILSTESLILTFSNIGEDIFPQVTEAALDMSQVFGQDLKSSAVQLGKALQEPVEGVSALRRIGLTLTDQQEKQIKSLVALGKVEEAQAIILEEVAKQTGNAARAAGETFAGQIDILKNKISNLKEGIGMALMPALSRLGDMFTNLISDPRVLQFIEDFSVGIATLADKTIDFFSNSENFDLSTLTGKFRDFMRDVDWQKVTDDVVKGIQSIDWVKVGQEVRTSAANIWEGIKEAATEIDWVAISTELGTALQGVTAGLYGYVDWESLKTDFNNGFASLFGYDTSLAFTNMQADFETGALAIGTPIVTAFENIKTAISISINATLTLISGFKNSITNILSSLTGTMSSIGKEWMTNLARGIKNGIAGVIAEVNKLIQQINNALGSIGFNIPLMGGVSAGGIGAAGGGSTVGGSASGGTAPKPKPGQVEKFAGGGIATGSSSGYLAMLHGTEGVFTREQMAMLSPAGGGGVTINLTYAPAFSTASADELEQKLMPLIQRGINQSRRNK